MEAQEISSLVQKVIQLAQDSGYRVEEETETTVQSWCTEAHRLGNLQSAAECRTAAAAYVAAAIEAVKRRQETLVQPADLVQGWKLYLVKPYEEQSGPLDICLDPPICVCRTVLENLESVARLETFDDLRRE